MWKSLRLSSNLQVVPSGSPAKSVKVDLPIDEVDTRWYRWQMKGLLIQQAFDVLTSEQREFLISGMTPQEWKELFG